ncbi:MAG: metalloregulator ArsR/SmtB family transcription factor [Anaerolineaceae bacterium]|nr:metalloregulator ArsR/SmtB family transcription factor [Anaerolineaceae bacterium]
MSEEQFQQLLSFFKVLGNESRLKILGLLATQERGVGELAALLDLREPTVSHHLAAMKELGLVNVRAEGNNRIYWLNVKVLENMSKDILSQAKLADIAPTEGGDRWEQKVLNTFMANGRITQIPSRRKKQLVIMQWVADQFAYDVRYPEAELNERLKEFNEDFASLRRYLIDYKLMAREKNVYWRIPPEEAA